MDRKIHLPENHRRSLSSSLIVVEKSLLELEELLQKESTSCCNVLTKDVDEKVITENLNAIQDAKRYICELSEKYDTTKEVLSLQRVINAKRARIWEILSDTLSKKIKGYGAFPKKYVDEYDGDINKLMELTERINS
ncbi:MAG TPA: hypothetical protein PLX08_09395 [Bacteroidales bacterium]|jgi:hypothetical protein|nr:hypothetical protein [Bacteroidales bacterium]